MPQISSQTLPGEKTLEANEIRKMAVDKSEWSQFFFVSGPTFSRIDRRGARRLREDMIEMYKNR